MCNTVVTGTRARRAPRLKTDRHDQRTRVIRSVFVVDCARPLVARSYTRPRSHVHVQSVIVPDKTYVYSSTVTSVTRAAGTDFFLFTSQYIITKNYHF